MIRTLMVATALATLASPAFAETITVAPGEDAQDRLQEALILAEPGDDVQRAAIGNQGAGRVWLFLETDDFARDHARLLAGGVTFEEAPRHEPYGTVAVFRDVFGHRWDLIEPRTTA